MTVDPRSTLAASSDAPSEAAKEKYGKALKAYGANRYADALLLLEDVRRLHSSPNALLLLGHCYAKLGLTASRLQVLPNKDYLYFSASGQYASKNLDSSEKFSLGGPTGVRAYPAPESPSDHGLIGSWEYRKPLTIESLPGDWVLAVFGDYAYGQLHVDQLAGATTRNIRKLMGHGLGLTYGGANGLIVKGYVAVRGSAEAQSDDSRARVYVQLSQPF